jgi:hypothetical protein
MEIDLEQMKKSSKKFNNFGEYLYYAYANLQMLSYALSVRKPTYDKTCFMIRAKAHGARKHKSLCRHYRFGFSKSNVKEERKSWTGFCSPWSHGSKAMGQTASLLAKAAPSLPHHSSIGS